MANENGASEWVSWRKIERDETCFFDTVIVRSVLRSEQSEQNEPKKEYVQHQNNYSTAI